MSGEMDGTLKVSRAVVSIPVYIYDTDASPAHGVSHDVPPSDKPPLERPGF